RTVHEGRARGIMPTPDLQAGEVGGYQRQRDTDILDVPDQVVGVAEVEGETEQRRHRVQRDVALVPVELYADGLLALEHLVVDHTDIAHARGIGARVRAGERKARDLLPLGE